MATTATPTPTPTPGATSTPKQQFLEAYEREHAITMRLLRAFPPEQAELRPHERLRPARELAFVFVLERGLGALVFNDVFASGGGPKGAMPEAPATWAEVLAAFEKAHADFGALVRATPDDKLNETVKFFVGPGTLGDWRRIDFAWFLLHDEIHHRGQLSVYLRMAGGKVPSIYGPTGDERWM
jgi:uncharacterized damage-inducible protein DinB